MKIQKSIIGIDNYGFFIDKILDYRDNLVVINCKGEKENMRKTRKIIAILLIISLLLPFIPVKVFAENYGTGDINFSMDIGINDNNFTVSNVTVNGNDWNDHNDNYLTADGQYAITGTILSDNGTRPTLIWGGDLNDYMAENATLNIRPENAEQTEYSFSLNLTNDGTIGFLGLTLEAESNNNPGGGQPNGTNTQNYQGNATSTLNYRITGAIEYGSGGGFDHGISFRINDIPYAADESKMQYSEGPAYERDENGQLILNENNEPIPVKDPETMEQMTEKTGLTIIRDTINYDYDTETNKVNFTFTMAPGTLMTGLKINGVTINSLPKTKDEIAACYTDHRLEINVNDIDKADVYEIEIEARYPNSNEEFLGNFLWDYNPEGYTGPDDKILNATLTFVEAEYQGQKYTTEEEINSLGGVFIWKDAERKSSYEEEREGCGEAQFPTGTNLTVRIIPDAGYQLVDFGINGGAFEPQEEIGTYTFEVKGGPFHLQANIAKVDDVVKTNSDKVESGTIELGGEEDSMAVGTAKLEVKDIDLNEEQISNFEEAAEGYEINNYLDISLFNTVFKGSESESWDTLVKELKNKAKITLKLEEGVDGTEVAIVHEKHDGTYEIIPVEYDAETNTITFKTKSFSNYAIATKVANNSSTESESANLNSPNTGDNIVMYIAVFGIAIMSLFTIKKLNQKCKIKK